MFVFSLFRLRVEEGKEGLEKSKIDSGLGSDDSARDEIESETASKTSAKISHVDVVICYWLLDFTTNVSVCLLQRTGEIEVSWMEPERKNGVLRHYYLLYTLDWQPDNWTNLTLNGQSAMSQLRMSYECE